MKTLLLLVLALPVAVHAGNSYFVTFPVQAPTSASGEGALVAAAAGVTLVRHQIPGEPAVQLAGPDGPGLGRIYTQPGKGSFVLVDVGSQWPTSVSQLQTVLGVVETVNGQFGWQGKAYSGAVTATVSKGDIVAGRLSLDPLLMSEIPAPSLLQADASHIQMTVPGVLDLGGLATGVQLWRRTASGGWEPLAELTLTTSGQAFDDTSVVSGTAYWYGISLIYPWPGGGQAGARPEMVDKYVSWARSESGAMVAALVQPTPTPFPTLPAAVPTPNLGGESWLAYPNPSRDGKLKLSFHTMKQGSFTLLAYTLDGSLAKTISSTFDEAGWQQPWIDLSKLSTGIYLLQLRVTQEGSPENTLPLRKVAIVR
jgi:hypothetical protein